MKRSKNNRMKLASKVAKACIVSTLLCSTIPITLATAATASIASVSSTQLASVGYVKGFRVEGTTLYDATGKPFVMRGVNHAHTWYKQDLAAAIPAIAATGANTVRIVLSDGGQWTRDDLASVQQIIALCDQYKLTVMLEVHDATGSNSTDPLNRAVNYWISIKDALIGKEDRVIVNIANEWFGAWETAGWASGYISAIQTLRDAGIKNTLVVDAAGWGQYPTSIFSNGKAVFDSDPLKNMIFSIHMYEYSGGNASTVKSNIDNALAIGVPVIIGEFGHKHSSGDVDEDTIMSYGQEKNVGWLAWSWYGNGGGVEYLDLATGPAGSLTAWGASVVNGPNGLHATSQLSGIYTTPGYQPVPEDGSQVTVPAAPASLSVTAGNAQATLSWSASAGAASYNVKRATTSGGPYTTIATGLTSTSFTSTGLSNGTTYYYVVSAVNSAGEGANTAQVSVVPKSEQTVPAAPSGLTAAAGNTQVSLSWSASTGATSYTVKRATTNGGPYISVASGLTSASFIDTGLTNGTTYHYVVSAVNSAGESANSASASAVPQGTTIPASGLIVQYLDGDRSNPNDNQIKPQFNIKNAGNAPVQLRDLKLRYYFSKDGTAPMSSWIDWAQLGGQHIQRTFTDTYVELSFAAEAGSIPAGGQTGEIQLRMSKNDWSNFNESNDYSYDPTKLSFADWDRVALYQNGSLVWGNEP
jgi:mannan endo-1,4-beta-mannosidase